jgi:hypothetical protein
VRSTTLPPAARRLASALDSAFGESSQPVRRENKRRELSRSTGVQPRRNVRVSCAYESETCP